jgi:hypothetical protein
MKLLIAFLLCIAFWTAVVCSCHGAPGGTPSPRLRFSGQKEIWRPRGLDPAAKKIQALCLNQDPHAAKLILKIMPCVRAHDGLVNSCEDFERGKFSPIIRSISWTASMSCEAKYYLVINKNREISVIIDC